MTSAAEILRDFTPGAYGIWTGVLLFAGWLLREYRETRKLSSADRQARREGFSAQVDQLADENRDLRGDLRALREEYDRYRSMCQTETDGLRGQIIKLEFDMAGLRRRADTLARDVAQLVSDGRTELQPLIDRFDAATMLREK